MKVASNLLSKGYLISFISVIAFTPAASGEEKKPVQDIDKDKQSQIERITVSGQSSTL